MSLSLLEEIDMIIATCLIEHQDDLISLNEVIEYQIQKILRDEIID